MLTNNAEDYVLLYEYFYSNIRLSDSTVEFTVHNVSYILVVL